jgi:hypothetical protein
MGQRSLFLVVSSFPGPGSYGDHNELKNIYSISIIACQLSSGGSVLSHRAGFDHDGCLKYPSLSAGFGTIVVLHSRVKTLLRKKQRIQGRHRRVMEFLFHLD